MGWCIRVPTDYSDERRAGTAIEQEAFGFASEKNHGSTWSGTATFLVTRYHSYGDQAAWLKEWRGVYY